MSNELTAEQQLLQKTGASNVEAVREGMHADIAEEYVGEIALEQGLGKEGYTRLNKLRKSINTLSFIDLTSTLDQMFNDIEGSSLGSKGKADALLAVGEVVKNAKASWATEYREDVQRIQDTLQQKIFELSVPKVDRD